MAIRFSCPRCNGNVKVPDAQAGQPCVCPRCNGKIVAPGRADAPAETAPPASSHQVAVRPEASSDQDDDQLSLAPPADLTARVPSAANHPGVSIDKPRAEQPNTPPPTSHPPATADEDEPLRLQGDEAPPSHIAKAPTFTMECPVCETRYDATEDKIGGTLPCPDCNSENLVRRPKLLLETTSFKPQPAPVRVSGETPELLKAQARERLAAAERALDEQKEKEVTFADRRIEADLPVNPIFAGVVNFLAYSEILPRAGLFGLAIGVCCAGASLAIVFMSQESVLRVAGPLVAVPVIIMALIAVTNLCAALLHVLQESAGGADHIQDWPDDGFAEKLFRSLYIHVSLAISVLPGGLLAMLMTVNGAPANIVCLPPLLSFFAFFPPFILSSLENGSPIMILSHPVINSIGPAARWWTHFYFLNAALATIACVAVYLSSWGILLAGLAGFVLVAVAFVLARALGRLGWCCVDEASKETKSKD